MKLITILTTSLTLFALTAIPAVEASTTLLLRMWDKPGWTGDEIQKNFQYGQCKSWAPAVGAYVQSAATQIPGIKCKVYGSNDHCGGDGHVFNSIVKNAQREGLPTLWRSFKCHPTFAAAEKYDEKREVEWMALATDATDGETSIDAKDLMQPAGLDRAVVDDPPAAHSEGEGGGKVQPGSAGWSYSAASTTAPPPVWLSVIAGFAIGLFGLTVGTIAPEVLQGALLIRFY